MERKGEKIGWIGGWLGGFVWLLLLSILLLIQNRINSAISGIILFVIALTLIFRLTPWRYPNTKYWKLMLPIYLLFFISVTFCIYVFGGPKSAGLNWFSYFWIIPCLVPFVTVGSRKWNK